MAMKEALLYTRDSEGNVVCGLCRHNCTIKEGRRGLCGVRENRGGVLETLVYGKLVAAHVDPIEKKPLFHFIPGSLIYSVATAGCNFSCSFCQNADIAQMPKTGARTVEGRYVPPEDVLFGAIESGCRSVAFTYTEPTVFFEYALDVSMLAREKGLKTVFVSNGYMSEKAADTIAPYLDAANIDLKSFSGDFYKTYCGARLEQVKECLVYLKSKGVFLEVTTLIIPGLNDGSEELEALARFIHDELGPETPWHISRFHPTYKLTDRGMTPVETLNRARETGLALGLCHVYTGNVPGHPAENTFCRSCGKTLVERRGYMILKNSITKGGCPYCGAATHGVYT
jgi:pyruvate formate lyase activating enzyme